VLAASHKTTLKIGKNGTAFEITFYVVDSSVMRPDAILGRDLLNYKGIQICADSHGTRLYFNNVQNVHNVAISTETVHTPLKNDYLNSIHFQYIKFDNFFPFIYTTKSSDFSNFCGVIGYNFFLL
jgi:hypothetical protein